MQPREYGFQERLLFSHGQSTNVTVQDVLLAEIPGAVTCESASLSEDKNGTDWWVHRHNGRSLSVDCKIRKEDWSVKPAPYGSDDLALETYSVIESKVVGWTRNADKQTDYILWLWLDTGRWCLVPFPLLCAVFADKWAEWRGLYKTRKQKTTQGRREWHSECVFVPRRIVWREIYIRFSGHLKEAA